jgi:hypothetical protein
MQKFIACGALALCAGLANADIVAYWSFFDTVPPSGSNFGVMPINANLVHHAGGGVLTTDAVSSPNNSTDGDIQHFTGSGINVEAPFPNGSDISMRAGLGQRSEGKSYFFQLNTSLFEDITLTYAERVTSTGPANVAVAYSTDGVNWTGVASANYATTRNATYALRTVDLTAVNAIENAASTWVRLTFTGFGATSTTGNIRMDNIKFDGTRIPTPGTCALVGMGLLAAARRRR